MPETVPVRHGEEIDAAQLGEYLRGTFDDAGGEFEVEQFPGGSSNLTYLVRQGRAEYVLRRPPFGNTVKTAHDMRREFDVLSKLSAVYSPAPKPSLFCDDTSVIGSEFYLMERRRGLIIRGKLPGTQRVSSSHVSKGSTSEAATLETSESLRLAVCHSFIQNLCDLHTLDYKACGLESLGRIDGYNRRQVEGWTKRYETAKTHEHAELEQTITWLNANIPPESRASLVHNDYKFDNVMLDPDDLTRITAVLDWEMVTIGDPLMDLGTTLGYWMSRDAPDELLNMPFNPRVLMENITRQQLVDMYSECLGRAVPDMLYYYVFGTFKIACIAQQIYARYVKGFTSDARFANFDKFVAALGRIAANSIETGI
ncbi:MAG: phosphotransferase family protein [Chloracidobacterium sp.]|nr:phosphotransferase family protein [Chloracidobacterium sp.]